MATRKITLNELRSIVKQIINEMTFEQFYQTVTKQASVNASKEYVRILWSNAYTIEQAVHNLQTMDES